MALFDEYVGCIPITLGREYLDRSVALDGYPPGTTDLIPIPGFALERSDGSLILFDTGFDPEADLAELTSPGLPPPEIVSLPEALAGRGYSVEQVEDVILSHLMVDHAGGLKTLKPGTRVWVQEAEWEYATGPAINRRGYRGKDLDGISVEFEMLDGEAEPWSGVRLIPTPGHCIGHQSALVQLKGGPILLTADASDLLTNLRERVAPGLLLYGREAALASIDRLNRIISENPGTRVIPGHDPEVWKELPEAFT